MVAAYWDDLIGTLEFGFVGVAPNRVYIVNWDAATLSGGHNTDFQLQIHETSNVMNVKFFDMDPGDEATAYQYTLENLPGRQALSKDIHAYLWEFLHNLDGSIPKTDAQPVAWEPWTAADAAPTPEPAAAGEAGTSAASAPASSSAPGARDTPDPAIPG